MNRALVCNFEELGSLFVVQRACEVHVALDPIEHSFLSFALSAIGRVDLRVPQSDANLLERPAFAPSVHSDRHRSTRAQGREQQVVRRWSHICAACGDRFVGMKAMSARGDFLHESRSPAMDDDRPGITASCSLSRFVARVVHVNLPSVRTQRRTLIGCAP